jgi:ribonuclease HII
MIASGAVRFAVGEASVVEIDTINILQATLLAMRRAVEALPVVPHEAIVDGNQTPRLACPVHAIVKGDRDVASISAASILAKTARDALMRELDATYPAYGFAHNKGYGTPDHLAALDRFGPCAIHRRSFAPVLQISLPF